MIDENAHAVSSCIEGYPLYTPKAGWSEQDPADWWAATKKVMKNAGDESGADKGDMARAVMEGATFGLRDIYELINLYTASRAK